MRATRAVDTTTGSYYYLLPYPTLPYPTLPYSTLPYDYDYDYDYDYYTKNKLSAPRAPRANCRRGLRGLHALHTHAQPPRASKAGSTAQRPVPLKKRACHGVAATMARWHLYR